jgi:hypothetical protein
VGETHGHKTTQHLKALKGQLISTHGNVLRKSTLTMDNNIPALKGRNLNSRG